MRFYWPIQKLDHEQHMVWGYASTEAEDEQGEVIRRDALAAALEDYMRFANIREMHQPSAVGIAAEAAIDDKGLYLGARIVDDDAWRKVVAGVYKGFSIGGHVTARDPADRNIVTGLALSEISVVDRPANPEAVFDCWKRAPAAAPAASPSPPPRGGEGRGEVGDSRAAADKPTTPSHGSAVGSSLSALKGREGFDADKPYGDVAYAESVTRTAGVSPATRGRDGGGPLPGRLRTLLAELCDLLDSFSSENTDAIAALALSGGLRKVHHAETAELSTTLAKLAADILPRLDALQCRVEDIAQTPLPPLTVTSASRGLSAIGKRDGVVAAFIAPDDIVTALAQMSDEERALALIKAARATSLRPAR